ncbi:MAG TPA: hypothetical protein VF058_04765 [Actinomycetota bacterium]
MRCDAAERELSAALDGEPFDAAARAHVETCTACRRFETEARLLREAVRLEPAPAVPDLVGPIVERVRAEPPRRGWGRELAAFAAAAVVAALVVGGLPGVRRGAAPVEASEISQRVAEASREITSFRAVFEITERSFADDVPLRRFEARVTFRAPERFLARVRDRTTYPSEAWPRNDVRLAVDGDRWSLTAPVPCPREALPACASGETRTLAVRGRAPFDGDAPIPTDVILPMKALSSAGRLRVVGEGSISGRSVVRVELDYRDATPLLAFLQAGGSWRPFFPLDRVVVSLDAETWFPLGYRVLATSGAEREAWALRNGLPRERGGATLLEVRARTFVESAPRGWRPEVEGLGAVDRGFREANRSELPFEPVVPTTLAGLEPYREGLLGSDEILTSYARGLTWLRIRESRSWDQEALFGDVGPLAAPVRLPGGGFAFHEPPTDDLGHRLAIHAGGTDLYLESNLPFDRLLEVAASAPVRGLPIPDAWRTRRLPGGVQEVGVPLKRAVRVFPGLALPRWLPAEYRLWTLHLFRARSGAAVTAYFRRPGGELDGVGIRLHQAEGTGLPPPTDPGAVGVRIDVEVGRYSPIRGELEWVEDGIYRSLRAEGLDLDHLVAIARSMAPPGGAT